MTSRRIAVKGRKNQITETYRAVYSHISLVI
jgi:hypothetical protein